MFNLGVPKKAIQDYFQDSKGTPFLLQKIGTWPHTKGLSVRPCILKLICYNLAH